MRAAQVVAERTERKQAAEAEYQVVSNVKRTTKR
jgi:hypothetical protein